MEKCRNQKTAESFAKTVENNIYYLKETTEQFQVMCQMVTLQRNNPWQFVKDVHKIYKEIQDRITETKAIQQLLLGKYRQYYRGATQREKEITEFGFIAKTCYFKFEGVLMQLEAKKRIEKKDTVPHNTPLSGPLPRQ